MFSFSNLFVSQSGWLCPAFPAVSKSFASLHSSSSVSQSGFRLLPIDLFSLLAIHFSPSLAGGVRPSGRFQFICHPLKQFIYPPVWLVVQLICLRVWLVLSGSPAVSNSFVSFHRNSIDLPVWLVVSGFPGISKSHVAPFSNSFVWLSGRRWCPAFLMSPIHFFPLNLCHLFPSLAGGVQLSGCLQLICSASRHNGVHIFDISFPKSGPGPSVFNTFDLEMAMLPSKLHCVCVFETDRPLLCYKMARPCLYSANRLPTLSF